MLYLRKTALNHKEQCSPSPHRFAHRISSSPTYQKTNPHGLDIKCQERCRPTEVVLWCWEGKAVTGTSRTSHKTKRTLSIKKQQSYSVLTYPFGLKTYLKTKPHKLFIASIPNWLNPEQPIHPSIHRWINSGSSL